MIATIHSHTAGTCAWCRQATEDGVQVQFKDNFTAFLCKKDFWSALKARAAETFVREEGKPGVARQPQS